MKGSQIIAGLDVGSTKISVAVAEVNGKGASLLGIGTAASAGMKKGTIVNIDATVDSIRKAVKEAESYSGTRIKSVVAGISGMNIQGFNSTGAVGVRGKDVSAVDIERAIDSAKAVYVPLDREVFHVIPTGFVLDEQQGIVNPLGMSGVRLEAKVHIITGALSSLQNLQKCCTKADLDIADIIVKPLAAAHASLTRDEKEFGAVLIDIGGGTTEVALFKDGYMRHVSVLGVGGDHLTHDIAIGFRINMRDAENLKKASGIAFSGLAGSHEEIMITQAGGQERMIPRKYLAEIMQPRCEEMLELIKEEIRLCLGYELATCGTVLCGGSSLICGFDKLAETVLGLPVRIGNPVNIQGIRALAEHPAYAASIGLVAYVSESEFNKIFPREIVFSMFGRMKDWVNGVFR